MGFLTNLLAPKWAPLGSPDIKPITGRRWIAQCAVKKGDEEKAVNFRFVHKPSDKEVLKMLKAHCKTMNAGGDRHAFTLVDKETGKPMSIVHGVWTGPDTFVVGDMRLLTE